MSEAVLSMAEEILTLERAPAEMSQSCAKILEHDFHRVYGHLDYRIEVCKDCGLRRARPRYKNGNYWFYYR